MWPCLTSTTVDAFAQVAMPSNNAIDPIIKDVSLTSGFALWISFSHDSLKINFNNDTRMFRLNQNYIKEMPKAKDLVKKYNNYWNG